MNQYFSEAKQYFAFQWHEAGKILLQEWEIPTNYIARCFVLLGYCDGEYPQAKPRKENRSRIIE